MHIPSKALTGGSYWTDGGNGLAIGGFDPVAYFTTAAAQQGSRDHELVWREVAWRFVNEGNMDAFRRDPDVYAPQFGGHGAHGIAKGLRNRGNPQIWEIAGGKLYFFYSNDARELWRVEMKTAIEAGEAQWVAMQ